MFRKRLFLLFYFLDNVSNKNSEHGMWHLRSGRWSTSEVVDVYLIYVSNLDGVAEETKLYALVQSYRTIQNSNVAPERETSREKREPVNVFRGGRNARGLNVRGRTRFRGTHETRY